MLKNVFFKKGFIVLILCCFIPVWISCLRLNGSVTKGREDGRRLLFDDIFNFISGDEEKNYSRFKNCSCSCGLANQEIRIVGGRPTGINRYPWLARLVYDGQFHCGASLINQDYVITAAHCVRRLKKSKIRIILGDHDQFITTESPAIMRAVSTIIRHRNFDINSYNHDIALLKLRKSVTYSKHVSPVCLPTEGLSDPAGKTGTVAGWGRTSEGGVLPNVLHEVQVPILSLVQCRTMKYKASRITSNMLCAGKGFEDSCQGDSGGPLLLNTSGEKHTIVGIVSWGVGCGRPGYPGVYTRVTRYLDWMQRNLEDACFCID